MKTIFYTKTLIAIFAMLLIALNVNSQALPPTTTIPILTCQEGTISVPVTVNNFNGVGNISLRLNYDPTMLVYQSVVVNAAIPAGNTITTTIPDVSGQFRLSYSGAVGASDITLSDGSVLFTLTFTVKAGVTSVITPISWSTLQKDCEYSPVSPDVFNPEITPGNLSTYFINGSAAIKPIPVITGPNSVCPGTTDTYTTQPGMSSYTWNVSAGGIITAGASTNSITVTWPALIGSHSVSVNYTDALTGCMATTPTVYPVNVTTTISPTLTGPNSVCIGTTGMVYTTDPGMTGYVWTVSAGGTITAGGNPTSNTATVTWNTSGPQSITVDYIPTAGCTTLSPTVYTVNVTPTVGTPTAISISAGTEPTCQLVNASVTTAYTTTATDNTGFNWSISNAAAGSINPSTGVMTWANGFIGSVDIRVTAIGCNGPSPQVIRTVTITAPVGTPNAITISAGTEPTCQLAIATTTTTYATTAANSTGFNWSISNATAGNIDPLTGIMTWAIGFTGTVDIRVTANGCNGPSPQVIRTITITPTVGIPTAINVSSGTEPTCQLTIATTTTTYSTTSTNSTGFNWTLSNPVAGTINPTTGVMTWAIGFSGSVNIQVTANGCNGPSVQVIRTVTITPGAGIPTAIVISVGVEPTCKLANATTTTTYATTATNSLSFSWSISNPAAGYINFTTGEMTWSNGFTGSVDIQVKANGCSGSSMQVIRTVTVSPLVGIPTPITVSAGAEPTCQLSNTTTTTYATTATGNVGFNWSISNTLAGTINPTTGLMTWNNGFAGSVDIQVIANGCNGPSAQIIRTVTITPSVATPVFTLGVSSVRCSGAGTLVYGATAANSTGITYTLDAISSTAGNTINSATGEVTFVAGWTGTTTITATATGCNGSTSATHTVTLPLPTITGPNSVCPTSFGIIYTTQAGMSSYIWNISAGGTIIAGGTSTDNTVTVTWNTLGLQNISVNYTDPALGCSAATPTLYSVNVVSKINPSLTGPNSVCIGTTGMVYTTDLGMSSYVWSVTGGTITSGGNPTNNTATVTWNTSGPQSIMVDYTPSGGCQSLPTVYSVNVTPTVGTPTAIIISAGTEPTCPLVNASTTTYSTTATDNTGFNWSISNAAAGFINSSTGEMLWNNGFAGSVDIQVTANGCNGVSVQVIHTVNIAASVTTPVFTLGVSSTRCQGAGTVVYKATALNSTGITYSLDAISSAAGNTINSATGAITYTTLWNGVSKITATASDCNVSVSDIHTVTVNPSPIPTISGPASACVNSTGNVYTTEPGMINYIWSVSTGGMITAGGITNSNTVTVKWNTEGPQTVRVIYANATGCNPVTAALYPVSINPLPVPTITGNNNLCVGSTGVTYTTESGMTAYNWTISGGGSITSGGTSNMVIVSWNTEGPQTINVSYSNSLGCTAVSPTVYDVVVNPLPSPVISGPSSACFNSTGNVYTTQAGMSNYAWIVSAGGLITAGGNLNDNTVSVTWNTAGPQTVSVNYTNGNGCTATSAMDYPVTVSDLVTPSLNGSNSICAGTTGIVYTTEPGMTQYNWIISTGGTVTSGGTSADNTATITWNTASAQSVSVDYIPSGGCTSIPTVLPVTVNPLPTPTITGPSTMIVNTIDNVYTTQTGMSNYAWIISSGGTVTAGGISTSNTVTVTWNTAGPQTVSVNYANASGCLSMNPVTFDVTVNAIPDPAGSITGTAIVNVGAIGVTYSVASIPNATSYVWSLPAGASIASGDGTNSITVNYALSASAGNITVYGNNAFGAGIASPPFAVTFNPFPAIPGTITGVSTICQGTAGITYSVPSVNYATGYVWTIPSGATIMSGDNTNSITINYSLTAVSGNVTVYGTNASGNGPVSSSLVVTVNPLPATPVITVDATGVILTSNATTGNQWYDAIGLIAGATNQTYTATQNGSIYVMVTGACTSAKSNTLIITKVSVNATDKQIFGVYPNPSNGSFWIEYKSSENDKLKMVQVLDLLGKPIYQLLQTSPTSDYKEYVNIKNRPIGVYILVLTTESRKISRRVVITR